MREDFAASLEHWYAAHRRDLPWRHTRDPYRIWLSEVILQQTRVAQGIDYYRRFVEIWPTVERLAAADEAEVLRQWQGLGYYSRARNLLAAAREVAALGSFPETAESLRKLRGVGDYTAAAVASLAFDEPRAVVDGNVYRVLARVFGIDTPIDTPEGKKVFAHFAAELLDKAQPALYNQSIMEFGALQCTPRAPRCADCPLAESCVALAENKVGELPVKARRTKISTRRFVYFYLLAENCTLLRRRETADIWRGLYEPLMIEFDKPAEWPDILQHSAVAVWASGATFQKVMENRKHQLTHRTLLADGYIARLDKRVEVPGYVWIDERERDAYAVPRLVEWFYERVDAARS